MLLLFFSMIQICLPVANKKKLKYYFGERKNVLWDCVLVEKRYNTSAENNVLREGVWSKKDIILRRKKNVFWDCVWSKRYNNSPTKNIVFWSKKDIKLRRKKNVFWDCKKRYDASPEKKFFDVLLLPFAKQIVCFHLNVFSVVYCVYCWIVS